MRSKYSLFLLAVIAVFYSCEKDPSLVGSGLNPGGGLDVISIDTFDFTAFTIEEDSLNSTGVNDVWLGRTVDTRTGSMESSFYTQFRLTQTGLDLGANATLDSSFIFISYDRIYGPALQPFNIKVYEVLEEIDADAGYRSDVDLMVGSSVVAERNAVTLNENGGVLAIPLTNAFGNELMNLIGTTNMENNDNFLNYLRGLYFTVEGSASDAMIHLNLVDASTSLDLYYTSDVPTDSSYSYVIDNQSTWVSKYEADFATSDIATVLSNTSNNDEELYITAMSGTKANIQMPDLSFLNDAVVNFAEITFYQVDYDGAETDKFNENASLFLYQNLSDTSFTLLPGFTLSNFNSFGGGKELVTVDGIVTNRYSFNITQYVQDLTKNETETSSFFLTALANNDPARVVIGGGNHPTLPIKMKILFTLTE